MKQVLTSNEQKLIEKVVSEKRLSRQVGEYQCKIDTLQTKCLELESRASSQYEQIRTLNGEKQALLSEKRYFESQVEELNDELNIQKDSQKIAHLEMKKKRRGNNTGE